MTINSTKQKLRLATEDELFSMGFSTVPPSANLYQHSKYPGLIFKRANTFSDIKRVGGIFLFGSGGAIAYSGDFFNYGLDRVGCIRVPSVVNIGVNSADGPFGDEYPNLNPKSQYAVFPGLAQIVDTEDLDLGRIIEPADEIKVCGFITESTSIFWNLTGPQNFTKPVAVTVDKKPYGNASHAPSVTLPRTGGLMSTNIKLDVNHLLLSVKDHYIASLDAEPVIVDLYNKNYDVAVLSYAPARGSLVIPAPVNLYAQQNAKGQVVWATRYQYNVGLVRYEYNMDRSRFVVKSAADNSYPPMPGRDTNSPILTMLMPSTSYCCVRGTDLKKDDVVGGNIPPVTCVDFSMLFRDPVESWFPGSRYPNTSKFGSLDGYRALTDSDCFTLDAIPFDEVALSSKQKVPVGDVFGGLSPIGRSVKSAVLDFYAQVADEFRYLAVCSGAPTSAPVFGAQSNSSEKIALVSASRVDKEGVRRAIDAMLPCTAPITNTLQSFSNLVDSLVDKSIGNAA